jgi:hypothetical protein
MESIEEGGEEQLWTGQRRTVLWKGLTLCTIRSSVNIICVSYDSLFEDYNVRVARSVSIMGPYMDVNGHDMADTGYLPQYEIGNKILSPDARFYRHES